MVGMRSMSWFFVSALIELHHLPCFTVCHYSSMPGSGVGRFLTISSVCSDGPMGCGFPDMERTGPSWPSKPRLVRFAGREHECWLAVDRYGFETYDFASSNDLRRPRRPWRFDGVRSPREGACRPFSGRAGQNLCRLGLE